MAKFIQALHKKSAYDKKIKEAKNEVIAGIRSEAFYTIRLREAMKKVDELLDNLDVKFVVISIKQEDLEEFNRVIYNSEMKFYNITKIANKEEDKYLYKIEKKEIIF